MDEMDEIADKWFEEHKEELYNKYGRNAYFEFQNGQLYQVCVMTNDGRFQTLYEDKINLDHNASASYWYVPNIPIGYDPNANEVCITSVWEGDITTNRFIISESTHL